jgi:hypothetical protein
MKKYSLLLIIFLLAFTTSIQQIAAQEKTKEEQEKEAKIQLSIDQQKKAMAEKQKALVEAQDNFDKQREEINGSMKEYQIYSDSIKSDRRNVFINSPRGNRLYNIDEPFVFSNGNLSAFYGRSMNSDAERTTWDYSKSVKEKTFSKDYSFDVEKTVKSVVMSVMGDCKSGEIRIKIVMPNGKNYSDILIDESGNLNWRKSFTISETENQDKAGDWKFQITSTKATGFFKISLQAF